MKKKSLEVTVVYVLGDDTSIKASSYDPELGGESLNNSLIYYCGA